MPKDYLRDTGKGNHSGGLSECNSKETMEGRRRPGLDGIRVAHGLDCVGRGRFNAVAREDDQQRLLQRHYGPDLGHVVSVISFGNCRGSAGGWGPSWIRQPQGFLERQPSGRID